MAKVCVEAEARTDGRVMTSSSSFLNAACLSLYRTRSKKKKPGNRKQCKKGPRDGLS